MQGSKTRTNVADKEKEQIGQWGEKNGVGNITGTTEST